MSTANKLFQAASGGAGESVYVDDVFSTYLYTGNSSSGSTQSNGLDLSGEGGLVWVKNRDSSTQHFLFDTERGGTNYLTSAGAAAASTGTDGISFLSNGWSTAPNGVYDLNSLNANYTSWSFRKQAGFFDVVTYTGNGSNRTISHNLGSVPGFIVIKRYDAAGNSWYCFHTSLGNTKRILLSETDAEGTDSTVWNSTTPTDSVFSLGTNVNVNASGGSYIAYLFAHDDQSFGDNSDESIIKCGSYTGGTDGTTFVDLGFEPQFLLLKRTSGPSNWAMLDVMRGLSAAQGTPPHRIQANTSTAENTIGLNGAYVSSTGFYPWGNGGGDWNANGATYIYIAIRRPMKTPEAGTEVFGVRSYTETNDYQQLTTGNLVDLGWQYLNGDGAKFFTRLLGAGYLNPTSNSAANTSAASAFDFMDGFEPHYANNVSGFNPRLVYGFTRATGCFDALAYTGNGTAGTTYTHNLSVAPEMMIVKVRSIVEPWVVYHTGLNGGVTPQNYHIRLTNGVEAADSDIWNNTAPTSSVFTTGGNDKVNRNTSTYIAYLFATLAGVSKVGSYTGTGADLNVDCGFSAGARFILIKRTDATGDWYTYDSARGIVAGNDPYLLLNSTAAEVTSTDYIDPLNAGFTVTSSAPAALNASGGTYIFLAIA